MRCFVGALAFTTILTFSTGAAAERPKGSTKPDSVMSAATFQGLKFRSIGPALTSGRVVDFAVDPTDRSHYYVAVASGGVWKTVNAGTTFTPVFDDQASYSIGCVALDPNNPGVVWVGTGENNSQRSVAYGDGVYRSDDGGKSWKNMGLRRSEHIGKILVDPRNSNVVYVAAQGPLWGPGGERGLYKTSDGGQSWKAVLSISENTGVSDIAFDPRNPDVVYAAAYQRRRHVWTLIDGGPESALYKSTDAGGSWNKLTSGLPSDDVGRIGIAVSPVRPDVVYAIVEAAGKTGGFFRSTDRGATWEKRSEYVSGGPQYYNEIFCDPKNVDRVYSMDVFLMVTDDGGKNFGHLGERSKHVDNHAMWIDPVNTDYYLVGCDGGIYESFDRGATWNFKSNLPVTQFYRVTVDNAKPFYNIYGGTQDNFSLGGPSRTLSATGITNSDWYVTVGGDGFVSAVDPENPNIVYSESQYGGLVRFDKQSGELIGIKPQERKGEEPLRWNWDSPLLVSPHKHTRLYFAANRIFRSEDRGDSWTAISPDLTRQIDRNKLPVMGKVWSVDAVAKNTSTSFYGNITALTESPVKEGLLYAGTD
ncbi:MAG TPA: glycosyl hydrolase, partial [Bacteroidota bacterium]